MLFGRALQCELDGNFVSFSESSYCQSHSSGVPSAGTGAVNRGGWGFFM